MDFEAVLFYVFALLAVAGALGMVGFVRNVVAGALCLVLTMISLAGIYLLLGAYLVAVVQILVYAGAILVLFLFVIMLLNLRHDDFGARRAGRSVLGAIGASVAVALAVLLAIWSPERLAAPAPLSEGFGGYRDVGLQLFRDYVVPVEVAGLLLLAAIVGAVMLAKKEVD